MKYSYALLGLFFGALLAGCNGGRFAPASPAIAPPASKTATAVPSGYKLLYSFKGAPDGASPLAGLLDVNGTLYGTTLNGSTYDDCNLGCGTVFAIDPAGSERVIYNFKGGNDGLWPFAGLTALGGSLYGTTGGGGANSAGTVFSVTTSGSENVVHSFTAGNDGYDPEANLIVVKGTLYGTTVYGGSSACGGNGCGTVFKIARSGKERVLHAFAGGSDGARVYGPVTYMNGDLFGATLEGGGSGCGGQGCGTIFKLLFRGKRA